MRRYLEKTVDGEVRKGVEMVPGEHNLKLEGNCDFSSNNNVWTTFCGFFWPPF